MPVPFGSISVPAQGKVDIPFKVVPCTNGDLAVVTPHGALDASWAGIVWNAWVSAANTVTVRLTNVTASPIVVNAQNLAVGVIREN